MPAAAARESLGWTDVYTLTKAFAERAAEELWAQDGRRLSIVRPAIIESSLQHPYPGWIDGFKVADPLILAFGRGQLPDFPGVPDSVLDIIPVDFVVNAMLAAAANPAGSAPARPLLPRGLRRDQPAAVPRRCTRTSTSTSPSNPMPAAGAEASACRRGSSPATAGCERAIWRAERRVGAGDTPLDRLPSDPRTTRVAAHDGAPRAGLEEPPHPVRPLPRLRRAPS